MGRHRIGLWGAVNICVGLIVSTSVLLTLSYGAGKAGYGFIFSMGIAAVLNMIMAGSFSELSKKMPDLKGEISRYTFVVLGPQASIFSNISAYLVTNILGCSVELTMCGTIINNLIFHGIPSWVTGLLISMFLFIANISGTKVFSILQNIIVAALLFTFFILGVAGCFELSSANIVSSAAQPMPQIRSLSELARFSSSAFWLFIGVEFIIPFANDMKNPKRDIRLSMIIGLALLFGLDSLMTIGMLHYVKMETLLSTDIPYMVYASACLGRFGRYLMGLIAVLAGLSTANTVFGSVSRIVCGMAEDGLMPGILMKKNKNDVPVLGLLTLFIPICLIIVSGIALSNGLTSLLLAASVFWLFSYILINICLIVTRYRENKARRNERAGDVKKVLVRNIPQYISIAGNVFMICSILLPRENNFVRILTIILFALMAVYTAAWTWIKKPWYKMTSCYSRTIVANEKSD